MFGIPKKWTQAGGRAAAGLGAALTLGTAGVPAAVKDNTALNSQYKDYAKEVRLPETGREISRAIRNGGAVNNAYKLTGAQYIDRKDLKTLRNKKKK